MLVDEGKSLKKTQAKMALCCFTNEKLIVEFLLYFHSENPIVFCLDLYNHFQMQSCLIINMVSLVAFFALFYEENQGLYIYIYIYRILSVIDFYVEPQNHFLTRGPWEHLDYRDLTHLGIRVIKVLF